MILLHRQKELHLYMLNKNPLLTVTSYLWSFSHVLGTCPNDTYRLHAGVRIGGVAGKLCQTLDSVLE